MTPNGEPNVPDPLRTVIQARHPGITEELQDAINTLRKLQQIAGPSAESGSVLASAEASEAGLDGDLSLVHTIDGPFAPPDAAARRTAPTLVTPSGRLGAMREAPALALSDSFGRYQIVRLLGRGAMGAVYLAYDSQLQRHVALKTPTLGDNPQTVGRFFREARSAAQLRSPYVCPVYDVGQIAGVYYLSMAFIDGRALGRLIDTGELKDGKAIAGLTAKIARGVLKAHEAGIMHRDLKPDNIMIDSDGEPIVMDFGLAKRVDDIQVTAAGKILGTPAYMSPEQIEGDPKKIGPATDIYSLGVVLYHLLTGRLPFQGSLASVLRQVGSADPPRPSSVNPEVAAGSPLERICLKMMAKSPENRYASMAEVIEALDEAFQPAGARSKKPSAWRRLAAWLGRPFSLRSRAAPSAGPPGSSVLEKTSADLSHVPPASPRDAPPTSRTIDLQQTQDS